MAERETSTAIVPAAPVEGEYMMAVKDFDPAGGVNKFALAIPKNITSAEASMMIRAAILKNTTWKNQSFATVLHAVMYSDRMGLDIMAGDVYMAEEGRLSTTAGAKIRHAIGTGRIEGYKVDIEELEDIEIPWETSKQKGTFKGPNLKARVTVYVKGWKEPIVYETTLSEWFTGRNPNWRTRPLYMLRKNALSKALEEVAPLGVEADEAPPVTEAGIVEGVTKALTSAKEVVAKIKEKNNE